MSYDFLQWLDEKVLEYISGKSRRTGKDINFRCPICGDSKKSASKMRGHYYQVLYHKSRIAVGPTKVVKLGFCPSNTLMNLSTHIPVASHTV